MNRLVFRFEKGGCASADCFGKRVAAPLRHLIKVVPVCYPNKRVTQVELMIYNPEHRYAWVKKRLKHIDIEKLNERLGVKPPEPEAPAEGEMAAAA